MLFTRRGRVPFTRSEVRADLPARLRHSEAGTQIRPEIAIPEGLVFPRSSPSTESLCEGAVGELQGERCKENISQQLVSGRGDTLGLLWQEKGRGRGKSPRARFPWKRSRAQSDLCSCLQLPLSVHFHWKGRTGLEAGGTHRARSPALPCPALPSRAPFYPYSFSLKYYFK